MLILEIQIMAGISQVKNEFWGFSSNAYYGVDINMGSDSNLSTPFSEYGRIITWLLSGVKYVGKQDNKRPAII